MKLQTLRLHGFKSFADRTALDFRDGVTAIVGSNGCGKSNIADSIRWVLGEQRASALRGAKMDEVIFQGTARRRPLNFAEVSLLFDNESGRIPVPQTQLEVSRKVFREGGSEYAINRASCRLRDVQGLLRDTGLGANAYSIIEATMIDALLSDRAEERRALFEEAAGIGKYKDSRHAASRRLEAADTDLRRLDDLIAEVESKVRALGRQRRKAERHGELQRLRLDLEVAIAREELSRIEDELRLAGSERERLEVEGGGAAAERAAAEAVVEERRIEAAELGRSRTSTAAAVAALREKIDERERAILVGRERTSHADQRRLQLLDERARVVQRIEALGSLIDSARAETAQRGEAVARARENLERRTGENQAIRTALAAERASATHAAEEARRLAREIATREGQRAAAERQEEEARERHSHLTAELGRLVGELAQMSDQTELWETQAEDVRNEVRITRGALTSAEEQLSALRGREQRANEEVRALEDRVSTMASQIAAWESVEDGYQGFAPAVAAIMATKERFPGVRGPLADQLPDADAEEKVRGLEAYLGPLLHALVVDDFATARSIRNWFQEEWTHGGSLLLLPLDALRRTPERVEPANGWVADLLQGLEFVDEDPLESYAAGVTRIGRRGEVVEGRGIIRLTAARDEQGILSRRAALTRLRKAHLKATSERDIRYRERDELRALLSAAEATVHQSREAHRVADARLRAMELDAAAHQNQRSRLQEERERVEKKLADLERWTADHSGWMDQLKTDLQGLSASVADAGTIEISTREKLASLEGQWDRARELEAELRITLAQLEAESRESDRQLAEAQRGLSGAEGRVRAIDVELGEIGVAHSAAASMSEQAKVDLEGLFTDRDRIAGELALLDARLAEVDSELAEAGERARGARRRESQASEERHRLELSIAESRSRAERIRERLEAEWGRPWATLAAEAVAPPGDGAEIWRSRLRDATDQLNGLGPVNMLAVEEHAEESRRLEFLQGQRTDLVTARDNLTTAIREINKTARQVFEATFESVRTHFRRTFHSLFQGGDCDLWLTDASDPLESPIEIQASPMGKKTQRIHLLSGGERTLTALALLFALYLVKPSPFCVLDEVDAPLDETNVGRFIQLLQDFKQETQFIVITHHPRTMEAADWVYGVTMEEPGVSMIVGVELVGNGASGAEVVGGAARVVGGSGEA